MKKTGFFVAALLILSMIAAGAFAMGFRGMGHGFGLKNDTATLAIESGDYNAFLTAISANGKMHKNITLEQFNNLTQRYKEMAPIIDARQKARDAIANNDYDSWKNAMNSLILAQQSSITKDNFDKIVMMHQKMQGEMPKGKMGFGMGRMHGRRD